MKNGKINLGIQMFNFLAGDDWQQISSMEEAAALLKELRQAGYDGVEWCNFMMNSSYMDIELLKNIMDELGLKTCGLHFHVMQMDTFENDLKEAVQRCRILESPYLILAFTVPHTFGIEGTMLPPADPYHEPVKVYAPEQIDDWIRETDKILSSMKSACAGTDIKVLYHNHADEMRRGSDEAFYFDAIHPDGKEVDVYWVAKGLDGKVRTALDYVREQKDTVKILHIKDGLDGSVFPNEMCGWGKGTYPIQTIIDCALELGLTWVVSENDAPKNFGTSGLADALQTAAYVKEHLCLGSPDVK